MGKVMLALVLFLASLLAKCADSTTFTFKNNCSYTVWPGTLGGGSSPQLSQTGFQLPSGASPISLDAPTGWSGRFWARTQCSTDSSGKFSCLSGDCGSGQVACNGNGGAPPTTLVEFALQGDGGNDFYDISLVDGFNVPVSLVPQGGSGPCASTACAANVNSQCPSELQVHGQGGSTIGCKTACAAFNTDEYCCRGAYGTPNTCKPSNYSMIFKSACPQAYIYDSASTFTCVGASSYLITYCP